MFSVRPPASRFEGLIPARRRKGTGGGALSWPEAVTVLLALTAPGWLVGQAAGQQEVAVQGNQREPGVLLRTLLLPGWGQLQLGDQVAARRFLLAEAGLWLSWYSGRRISEWYAQDYRAYAVEHAGADTQGRRASFFRNLAFYDTVEDYNSAQLRNRNLKDTYPAGEGLGWAWDSSDNRRQYRSLRRTSLGAAKAVRFVIGGMLVNRALAAIQLKFIIRSSAKSGAPGERTGLDRWQIRGVALVGGGAALLQVDLR